MLNGQTILVVEEEFLIALDIQRILEGAGAGSILFARSSLEASKLRDRWPDVGLAIVEIHPDHGPFMDVVRALKSAGVPMILCSADGHLGRGHPDFPDIPVVTKPMAEHHLMYAIGRAISQSA